ncbi:MAG: flagellin [Pikeienuella sp.]
MSSILTNNSAMVALQTLNSTNRNLANVQNEISTGLKVSKAKDDAAIWAISQVMRSDVKGFEAVSTALGLGAQTLAVASNGALDTGEQLKSMYQKIVNASEENIDSGVLQESISAFVDQITANGKASQFNGLNLIENKELVAEGAAVTTANIVANIGSRVNSILSSLDRQSNQSVTTSKIEVNKQDLTTRSAVAGAGTDLAASAVTTAAIADGATGTITIAGDTATAARMGNAVLAGDSYALTAASLGLSEDVLYVAKDGDTVDDIAKGLSDRINLQAAKDRIAISTTVEGGVITLTNNTGSAVTASATLNTGGTASGGLEVLNMIDVTTQEGADAALAVINGLIQSTSLSQATLGNAEMRVEAQSNFISKLTDSFKAGIGALVDADMEAAAARLQALQVQQQLGTQALSIANQAPQAILSLFR